MLLAQSPGDDEHAPARRMALEEAALGQLELALDALLREVTSHTDLLRNGWRQWLADTTVNVAELSRLRELANTDGSWLACLLQRLDALHGDDGASRREPAAGMIASAATVPLARELAWCHRELKALLPGLREGSYEW
nr:DUF6586 family protein [Salinicola sp. S1-1-2]